MAKSRHLNIYERNQLLKYSFTESELLSKGELPVEYLTGFVNFKNLDLKVNEKVLIPRVETEELVDLAVEFTDAFAADFAKPISYLEVGTGSGAISLAFFHAVLDKLDKAVVTDFSPDALALAKENFSRLFEKAELAPVIFIESDLLSAIPEAEVPAQKFQIIVANLPYIPSAEINKLDESVKNYEPLLALDGGVTGFELIEKLLNQIIVRDFLAKDGKIFLEVHETHTRTFVEENFAHINQQFEITEIKDQFERQRFLVLQKR